MLQISSVFVLFLETHKNAQANVLEAILCKYKKPIIIFAHHTSFCFRFPVPMQSPEYVNMK